MAKLSRWASKRERMWKQNPNCYYCQRPTIIIEYGKVKSMPDNAATIEHLVSKLNPRRKHYVKGEKRHVIACHRCNHEQGRKECLALSWNEQVKHGGNRVLDTWFRSWFRDMERFERL